MFNPPFHPKLVHLPIGVAIVLPLALLLLAVLIHRRALPPLSWWLGVALSSAVSIGAVLSVTTGEREEGPVKKIVGRTQVHEHEEAGERFALVAHATTVLTVLAAAGRLQRWRTALCGLAVLTSVASLALVIWAGHLGGELVYRHGAARAFETPAANEPMLED